MCREEVTINTNASILEVRIYNPRSSPKFVHTSKTKCEDLPGTHLLVGGLVVGVGGGCQSHTNKGAEEDNLRTQTLI